MYGNVQLEDEELTPALESQIVADWLESIGGVRLIKFVFQEYSRELESCTIFDLQEMLGKKENMTAILEKMEIEEVSKLNRIDNRKDDQMKSGFGFKNTNSMKQTRHCYICEENGKAVVHGITSAMFDLGMWIYTCICNIAWFF